MEKLKYLKKILIFILFLLYAASSYSQHNRLKLGDTITDTYKYKLPIFGEYLHSKGVDLPLPIGIMANTFYAVQDIVISDISLGFSDGLLPEIPLTDVTRLIDFSKVESQVLSLSVRPDIWILPFLNVYGIFGKTYSRTDVQLSYPIELNAIANIEGTSYGFGVTGAGGVRNFFFVLDGNWAWSNLTGFKTPVRSNVFSFRFGRAFHFKKNPDGNVGVWLGGMRLRMGGITEGTITLRDVLPDETWERSAEIVDEYYAWYNNADPLKQAAADRILTPIIENIGNANGDGTISYKLTKKPKQEWNMLIGAQWQINKHYQFRAEGGVIGNRKSLLLSFNYRFGI